MKKVLCVDLKDKPENFEEFIKVIEDYCIKEKIEYSFIEKKKPATVMMDGKLYSCNIERVTHLMGMSWCLKISEA